MGQERLQYLTFKYWKWHSEVTELTWNNCQICRSKCVKKTFELYCWSFKFLKNKTIH